MIPLPFKTAKRELPRGGGGGGTVSPRFSRLLLTLPLLSFASTNCSGPQTGAELREHLWGASSGYARIDRPGIALARLKGPSPADGTPPAENVYVQLHLFSLHGVDTTNQVVRLELWERTVWWDWRLQYNQSCLKTDLDSRHNFPPDLSLDEIWVPSTFIPNMANTEEVIESNFWLRPDGRSWRTRKVLWDVKCDMVFRFMPFDEHNCIIRMGLFREGVDEVVLNFFDPPLMQTTEAVIKGNQEWVMAMGNTSRPHTDASGSIVTQSLLDFEVKLTRRSEYWVNHFLQTIFMVVTVSWASFFISRAAVPARVTMTIISMLTLSGIGRSILYSLPRLSGDVWILRVVSVSWYFSLYAVIEYVAANFLFRARMRLLLALQDVDKAYADAVLEKPASAAQTTGSTPVWSKPEPMQRKIEADAIAEFRRAHTPESPADRDAEPAISYADDPAEHGDEEIDITAARSTLSSQRYITAARSTISSQRSQRAIKAGVYAEPFSAEELAIIKSKVGRCDILLLRRDGKGLHHAGKFLDLFSRFTFPLAYGIAIGILMAELPAGSYN